MLIDVLHELLDEGKVIAVNGMLQIKNNSLLCRWKECPAADEEHLLSAMLLLFLLFLIL